MEILTTFRRDSLNTRRFFNDMIFLYKIIHGGYDLEEDQEIGIIVPLMGFGNTVPLDSAARVSVYL